MKKVKKEKLEGPVAYNRSIMAAFDKQHKGKTCPMCNVKFSLATYRTHMETCNVAEDDEDIEVIASYSREEAILLRAGPEIVINDEETPVAFDFMADSPKIAQKSEENPKKRRRTEEFPPEKAKSPLKPQENQNSPQPSTSASNSSEKPVKSSPAWENRRRSTRKAAEPVKKEKATIAEVLEAIKNFELRCTNSNTKWPYYMTNVIKILKKVISTQKFDGKFYSDDFWSAHDKITFYRFVEQISEEAKCLLCRLFLRRSGWFTLEKLRQKYPEITNISEAAIELTKWNFIEDESSLQSIDDAIAISDVIVLKNVAKKFKVDSTKSRHDTIQGLKKFAQSQKSIFGVPGNVEKSIMRSLKQELGPCVRIQMAFTDLLKAIFTIYCPVTTNSAAAIDNPHGAHVWNDLLYMMLSIDNGSVKFPSPNPCPNIASFFRDRSMLYDYTMAKSLETTMVQQMANGKLETALDLAIDAREYVENVPEDQKSYYEQLEVHERKFTAVWVLVRCCAHGATVLEKQKKYGMAVEWQKWILTGNETKNYCLDYRGGWWDRMLLNLDSHLKEKVECSKMLQLAVEDPFVLEKELLSIEDRAQKLKIPDFQPKILLAPPIKKEITGRTISKNLGDGRVNRFVIRNEEMEEDVEVSVEEVVRLRYLEQEGFCVGVHDEGATWHTLFGLLFYDVIFPDAFSPEDPTSSDPLDSTWLSEVQDAPTDLSNSLYSRRIEKFEKRFEWLKEAESEQIEENIRAIWDMKRAETNRECCWDKFPGGKEDCVELFSCIPRDGLIAVFRRLAQNYRNCRSGFPDLTLWNPKTKKVAVVEVKGPGDRLSTKQRLWLAFFMENGIRAEVCHVTAENSKRLQLE